MIAPGRRPRLALVSGVLAAALAVTATGCGALAGPRESSAPSADPTASAPQAADNALAEGWWGGRDDVTFTMTLPPQWNDFTQDYLDSRDDPVLSAVWSLGETSNSDAPFATVSAFGLRQGANPRALVMESLEDWSADMADPLLGPTGYGETAAGGVVYWGSVAGVLDGTQTTIFKANVFHGPYVLNLIIETTGDTDDPDALALLDRLSTVEFAGPVPIVGRQGPPLVQGERWDSYCGMLSAQVQSGWEYVFTPDMDATPWRCPENTDYLGAWAVAIGGVQYEVSARLNVGLDTASVREATSAHGAPGEAHETPNGYVIAVVAEDEVALGSGVTATRIAATTTTPSGFESHTVAYYVELVRGTVEVHVGDHANSPNPETAWIEPFLASFEVDSTS